MMMTTSILQCGVFNPFSSAGIIGTSRIGMDGQYNVAYGVDGTFRLYGDDYLTFQWAHTFDEKEVFQRGSRPSESGRFSAEFEKRLQDGFGYETGFVWSGPDYYPGMGFIQRTDFTQFSQQFSYTYRHGEESRFISNRFLIGGELFYRNNGWDVETVQLNSLLQS